MARLASDTIHPGVAFSRHDSLEREKQDDDCPAQFQPKKKRRNGNHQSTQAERHSQNLNPHTGGISQDRNNGGPFSPGQSPAHRIQHTRAGDHDDDEGQEGKRHQVCPLDHRISVGGGEPGLG